MQSKRKLRVAVLFGGRSVEHEISVISATSVAKALQDKGYECVFIGIDKTGQWYLMDEVVSPTKSSQANGIIRLCPGGGSSKGLYDTKSQGYIPLDVIFPVLHGSHGEDGRIQGALDSCSITYVGGGVVASVLTNDKDITKRLLHQADIAIADYVTFRKKGNNQDNLVSLFQDKEKAKFEYDKIATKLKLPFWVKPANLGSSLGINQVNNLDEFITAVTEAFSLDNKIIIEEHIGGREMECSVLEDMQGIQASLPGEIILKGHTFYDYDAKYVEKDGATLIIPADVSDKVATKIKDLAIKVFRILENRHIMRLDMFLTKDDNILINEVQTIPGFTSISMYPKLLEQAGIDLPELVDRLVISATTE